MGEKVKEEPMSYYIICRDKAETFDTDLPENEFVLVPKHTEAFVGTILSDSFGLPGQIFKLIARKDRRSFLLSFHQRHSQLFHKTAPDTRIQEELHQSN